MLGISVRRRSSFKSTPSRRSSISLGEVSTI
ncbi:hypothetical protein LINPERHAP1_LOCUS27191 [Linum perenne]